MTDYICPVCKKNFSSNSNKLKHCRKVHFIELIEDKKPNIKCSECHTSFFKKKQLREHLNDVHELNIKEEILFFDSFKDFEEWKVQEERLNNVQFAMNGLKSHFKSNFKSFYYGCKRSGFYKPSGKLRRHKKSYKINATCPAFMSGKIFHEGNVQLRYISKHTHELDNKPKPNVFLPEEVVEIELITHDNNNNNTTTSNKSNNNDDDEEDNNNLQSEDELELFSQNEIFNQNTPISNLFKEIGELYYSIDETSKQKLFISTIRNTIQDWKITN